MVLGVFEAALTEIGSDVGDRRQLAREYLDTVDRLGLT